MRRSLFVDALEAAAKSIPAVAKAARSGLSVVGALVDCGIPRQHAGAQWLTGLEEDVEVWEPPLCGEHTGNCSNRCLRPPVHPGPHDDEPPTCSCYGPHTYGCMFHDALNYPHPQDSRTNAGATAARVVEEGLTEETPPVSSVSVLNTVTEVLAEHYLETYSDRKIVGCRCGLEVGSRQQHWDHQADLISGALKARAQAAEK